VIAVQAAWFAALGVAPDLDLLWGRHRQETHSLMFAAIVGAVAVWRRWPVAAGRGRIFLAASLAWASHAVLDALARDLSPPGGVTLYWPFAADHVHAGWDIFDGISRRWWTSEFIFHNARAILREVVLLAPVTLLVYWLTGARRPAKPDAPARRAQ
jgi:hypothetical protein